jgi:WD40 repeat protein
MEYLQHGDLSKHLFRPLPEDEARTICTQVLEGLKCMHENGFVHRDLKPQNILVVSPGPDWLVQISDFGICRRLEEANTVTMRQGTMGFMAPEMLGFVRRGSSPYAVDIWSLGALLFFVLTNTIFLKDLDRFREFTNGDLTAADSEMELLRSRGTSDECSKFLRCLLAPSPDVRPSSEAALDYRWLAVSREADRQEAPRDRREEGEEIRAPETMVSAAPQTEASATWSSTVAATEPRRWSASALEAPVKSKEPRLTRNPSFSACLLASVSWGGTVNFWDPTTGRFQDGKTVGCLRPPWTTSVAAFSPDLKTLAISSDIPGLSPSVRRLREKFGLNPGWNHVEIWDLATRQRRHLLKGHRKGVDSIAFSADSRQLAFRSVDGRLSRWDLETGEALEWFPAYDGEPAKSVALSADLYKIVTSSDEGIISEDAATGHRQWVDHKCQPVGQIALSPDSSLVASATVWNGPDDVGMWNDSIGIYSLGPMTRNERVQTLKGHPWVTLVAFSPDSDLLASASEDGAIKVWKVASGECTQTLKGHKKRVNSIAFLPNSTFMATASDDGTIRIWDLEKGKCVRMLAGSYEPFVSVAFKLSADRH